MMLVVVAVVALWSSGGEAITCSAPGVWDPAPSVTNASPCGAGTTKNNSDPETFEVSPGVFVSFDQWDKDEANQANDMDLGFYFIGTSGASGAPTRGFWYWNATASLAQGNDTFAIVLKDGGSGVSGSKLYWAWFIIDNPAGAPENWLLNPITGTNAAGVNCAAGVTAGSFTHCGSWTMYGSGGTIKALSHISIYGADVNAPDVAEPAALVLLGLGLVALAAARRTKGRRPMGNP